MWEDFPFTWLLLVLPPVAGIVSLLKGRYRLGLLGVFPLTVGGIAAAIEYSRGGPELSTLRGLAAYSLLASPLAIFGAVQKATPNSLLGRWMARHEELDQQSWQSRLMELGSISSAAVLLVATAVVALVIVSVVSSQEQREYEAALIAEPDGETALTDFQFGPNFNRGEIWTVIGTVDFGPDYAEVPPWTPGQPMPALPTHPGIDYGLEDGPHFGPDVEIKLYFHDPPRLQGEHTIRVTCRVKGSEDSGFFRVFVLDACRDLEVS